MQSPTASFFVRTLSFITALAHPAMINVSITVLRFDIRLALILETL